MTDSLRVFDICFIFILVLQLFVGGVPITLMMCVNSTEQTGPDTSILRDSVKFLLPYVQPASVFNVRR
jgi:hypothetical protein